MKMTNDQMRVAVAEILGWIVPKGCVNYRTRPDGKNVFFNPMSDEDPLPNYPECLNACASMEAYFTDDTLMEKRYLQELWKLIKIPKEHRDDIQWSYWPMVHATAQQRCIAFLKTHNRYE